MMGDTHCSRCGLRYFDDESSTGTAFQETHMRESICLDRLRAENLAQAGCLADVKRLVREFDVAMNGEHGAAPQASLCDVLVQALQRIAELEVALRNVKCLCAGEARPRWDASPETTRTRGAILDICDAALRLDQG